MLIRSASSGTAHPVLSLGALRAGHAPALSYWSWGGRAIRCIRDAHNAARMGTTTTKWPITLSG
jgi:hypothetical protein